MKIQNSPNLIQKIATILGVVGATLLIALVGYSQPNSESGTSNQTNPSAPDNSPNRTNTPGSFSPGSETTNSPSAISALDRTFVINAAQDSMAEVQLGQLARQQAASDAVKEFAQRMIQDHTQMNNELAELARTKGLTLPTDIGVQNRAVMARLSKLSGSRFDRAYMNEMVNAHARDIALFQRQAEQGQDRDLKNLAARRLPTLEEHLQMARNMTANQ